MEVLELLFFSLVKSLSNSVLQEILDQESFVNLYRLSKSSHKVKKWAPPYFKLLLIVSKGLQHSLL